MGILSIGGKTESIQMPFKYLHDTFRLLQGMTFSSAGAFSPDYIIKHGNYFNILIFLFVWNFYTMKWNAPRSVVHVLLKIWHHCKVDAFIIQMVQLKVQ